LNDVTGEALRRWRESQGWDVPRMAREIRKAARDCGEDVAAHHGLVKMIPQWERGGRAPRERYRLLYLKVFQGALGELSGDKELGVDVALQIAEVRARAAQVPRPRGTMTTAESKRDEDIRRLVAELDVHLAKVESDVVTLKALLDEDEDEDEGLAGGPQLIPPAANR
jgi:transcriptional regulator with XRE-family HTH domain